MIADSNYPHYTGAPASAARIHLNLAPGLISATDVLAVLLNAVPVEAARVMVMDNGQEAPIVQEFRKLLPAGVPVEPLQRFQFYYAVNVPQTSVLIATGEQRLYANLLLTVGVMTAEGTPRFSGDDLGPLSVQASGRLRFAGIKSSRPNPSNIKRAGGSSGGVARMGGESWRLIFTNLLHAACGADTRARPHDSKIARCILPPGTAQTSALSAENNCWRCCQADPHRPVRGRWLQGGVTNLECGEG